MEAQDVVRGPRHDDGRRRPEGAVELTVASVCVFLGSHGAPAYEAAAARLGATIAERGLRLVYGGASVGLMGVLADAALAAGGEVVGVALGIFAKPLGFLEVDGFWAPMLEFLRAAVDRGVMSERRRPLFDVVDTDPSRLLDRLLAGAPPGEGVVSPDQR